MLKYITVFLALTLYINTSQADVGTCNPLSKQVANYTSTSKGEVVIYHISGNVKPSVTDVTCLLATTFFDRIGKFPDKLTLGVLSESGAGGAIIKWDTESNSFLVIEVSEKVGIFTKYPNPLERLAEVLTNRALPKREDLPLYLQPELKVNVVKITQEQLQELVNIK